MNYVSDLSLLGAVAMEWANTRHKLKLRVQAFDSTIESKCKQIHDLWSRLAESKSISLQNGMMSDKAFLKDLERLFNTLKNDRTTGLEFKDVWGKAVLFYFWRVIRNAHEHQNDEMVEPHGWATRWYWYDLELKKGLGRIIDRVQLEGTKRGTQQKDFQAFTPPVPEGDRARLSAIARPEEASTPLTEYQKSEAKSWVRTRLNPKQLSIFDAYFSHTGYKTMSHEDIVRDIVVDGKAIQVEDLRKVLTVTIRLMKEYRLRHLGEKQ